MRVPAIEAAQSFVANNFPNSDFSILAGSASRGEDTLSSDLDIVIFQNESDSYRESFFMYDWRIETFIHNHDSYLTEFEREKNKGRPILGNMISEGKLIGDSKRYETIKNNAQNHVSNGPASLSKEYIKASRYFIGDLLDDFVDAKSYQEAVISLNDLSLKVPDFLLRVNNQWSGRGKGLARALYSYDERAYHELFSSLDEFYKNNKVKPFRDFVNKVYEPVGGLLFEGFSSGKK